MGRSGLHGDGRTMIMNGIGLRYIGVLRLRCTIESEWLSCALDDNSGTESADDTPITPSALRIQQRLALGHLIPLPHPCGRCLSKGRPHI